MNYRYFLTISLLIIWGLNISIHGQIDKQVNSRSLKKDSDRTEFIHSLIKNADGLEKESQSRSIKTQKLSRSSMQSVETISSTDRAALIAFYNSTNGDSWTNNSGWKDGALHTDGFALPGTEGTWFGVTLNAAEDAVSELKYDDNNLTDTIPTEIGDFSSLERIMISYNPVTGSIPAEIGNLTTLKKLDLYGTELSGTLPASIGNLTNLTRLWIEDNNLTGTIPNEFANLTNLQWFLLGKINLSGTIPSWIGNLSNLQLLNITWTQITGNIPVEILNLSNLFCLCLYDNDLTGQIPSAIGNLSNLVYLYLDDNNLEGSIPASICNLTNLYEFMVERNNLSGTLPSAIGNLSSLNDLTISKNKITGEIPLSIVNLTDLEYLYTEYNGLYTNDASVQSFIDGIEYKLVDNQTILPANITTTKINNTTLQFDWDAITYTADAGGYRIYKSTSSGGPYSLLYETPDKTVDTYTASGLDEFVTQYFVIQTITYAHGLNANAVESEYSAEFSFLGNTDPRISRSERNALIALYNCTNGDSWDDKSGWKTPPLYSDGFGLPGTEAVWYGVTLNEDEDSVYSFDSYDNNMSGTLPSEIGNLSALITLKLIGEPITGSIPAETGNLSKLQELWFYDTQMSGSIPNELGNLQNLIHLEIFASNFSGEIPTELGNLSNLEYLNLGYNKFSGSIPSSFANLTELTSLYLWDNQFSGQIPAGVINLPNLESFAVSKNKITGDIPLQDVASTSLTYVQIKYNGLFTNDSDIKAFLDSQDAGWETTQTVAPTDVTITRISSTSAEFDWTPISYTANSGTYAILYSNSQGGPFTQFDSTSGKSANNIVLTGLNANSDYSFVIQTKTFPHVNNVNTVESEYSEKVPLKGLTPTPWVINNKGAELHEGGSFIFTDSNLKFGDDESPSYSLNYRITSPPVYGTISLNGIDVTSFTQNDIANGKVIYNHSGQDFLKDSFNFTVSDDEGNTTEEFTFVFKIIPKNDPPVIMEIPQLTINEDENYTINFSSLYDYINDPDNPDSTLIITITNMCNNICTNNDSVQCCIYGIENWFGKTALLIKVNDGIDTVDTIVPLIVLSVNDLPIINGLPSSVSFVHGDLETIDLIEKASDIETPDSSLLWSFSVSPDSVNINYNTATKIATLSAKGSFEGDAELTLTVTDADGGSASATITATVTPDPTGISELNGIPTEYKLYQNYPNPFNPSTVIRYVIPVVDATMPSGRQDFASTTDVTLKVFDILGNEVATMQNGTQSPGYYERTWHAKNVSSGIYFYILDTGSFREIKKMILIK